MRNLKRVLALAMAMVMILGMMVIGSSAASYSDAAAIDEDYAEAVEVLSGLGVFKGTGAGFAPKQILTRGEAAALIYRVITGDVNDKQAQNYDYASLKDIQAGQWYTPYVTYANNGGYIKGDDQGNFNPNAQVTGIQVLAIMLRAAGYGQNGEYEGAGWMDNILTDAFDLKIIGNISTATLNAPATRELVAQLIFNAITEVEMVRYNLLFNYLPMGETLGEKTFSLAKVEGVITDTLAAKGTTTLTDAEGDETTLKNTDADWTTVGYAARAWVVGTKALSLVITGKDLSVTTDGTTIAAMTENAKKATYVETLDDDVIYVLNGEVVRASQITDEIGAKIALVNNDRDDEIDAVVCTAYTAAQVTDVIRNSKSGTITDKYYVLDGDEDDAIDADDLANVDALAKGDYITYVVVDDEYYVTVLEAVEGEFEAITYTKINGDKVKAYTIDEVDYVASAMEGVDISDLIKGNINDEVTYVLDEYGYIVRAAEYVDSDAYLFVLANEDSHGIKELAETEVVYADGTVEIVDVDCSDFTNSDGDDGVDDDQLADEEAIWTYTEKTSGAYELEEADYDRIEGVDYETKKLTMYGDDDASVKISLSTTIVDLREVIDGKADEGEVYVGYKEIPDLEDATIVYLSKNGTMTLGFLVEGDDPDEQNAEFVVFDTTINTVKKSGKYTYTLKAGVIIDGELEAPYVLTEAQKTAIETYGVGVYEITEDDGEVEIEYTSFYEGEVYWTPENSGTVILDDEDVTEDYEVIILNIEDGEINDWDQLVKKGTYYAYVDGVGSNKVIYIVGDGKVGTDIVADGIIDVVANGNAYTVETGKVTKVEAAEDADVTTVDTDTLADALAAAEDGDTLYLAAGEYDLTAVLAVNADVTIVGETGSVMVSGYDKVYGGMNNGGDFVFNIKNSDVTVKNMTFKGHDADDANCWWDAVANLSGTGSLTMEDCIFLGDITAVYVTGADAELVMTGCDLTEGAEVQLDGADAANVTIEDCVFGEDSKVGGGLADRDDEAAFQKDMIKNNDGLSKDSFSWWE